MKHVVMLRNRDDISGYNDTVGGEISNVHCFI